MNFREYAKLKIKKPKKLQKGDHTREYNIMTLTDLIERIQTIEGFTVVIQKQIAEEKLLTDQLRDKMEDLSIVNLNLELSKKLLTIQRKKYPLKVQELIEGIVNTPDKIILLDHIEIIFDSALKQNPLKLLQNLSRNRSLIAIWPGKYENGMLTYAVPGHQEYFSEINQDATVLKVEY